MFLLSNNIDRSVNLDKFCTMLNLLCLASGSKPTVLYCPNKWNQSLVTNKVISNLWCSQQSSPTGSNIFASYPSIDFFLTCCIYFDKIIDSALKCWSLSHSFIHAFNSTSFIISPTWVIAPS